jgi:hypothetical protein
MNRGCLRGKTGEGKAGEGMAREERASVGEG